MNPKFKPKKVRPSRIGVYVGIRKDITKEPNLLATYFNQNCRYQTEIPIEKDLEDYDINGALERLAHSLAQDSVAHFRIKRMPNIRPLTPEQVIFLHKAYRHLS